MVIVTSVTDSYVEKELEEILEEHPESTIIGSSKSASTRLRFSILVFSDSQLLMDIGVFVPSVRVIAPWAQPFLLTPGISQLHKISLLLAVSIQADGKALHHRVRVEITEAEFFQSFGLGSNVRIDGASSNISLSICLFKDIPEEGLLLPVLDIGHEKLLARSTIDIIQSFQGSTHLGCLVTPADFGPCFLDQLYPHFTFAIFELTGLVSGEAELLNSILVEIKWEPIINHDDKWLSVDVHLDCVASRSIGLRNKIVISNSFSELQMRLLWSIFSKTCESGQEVAIGMLTLHDISGVDTIEDERNTTVIFEVVSCSSPIESATSLILPEVVSSVLDTINIKSLRTVWECSVTPWLTSLDDLFIR